MSAEPLPSSMDPERSPVAVATWSVSKRSSSFWMRSAGFPYEHLDGFASLAQDDDFLRHEADEDRRHEAESALRSLIAREAPGALPKLTRRFQEGAAMGPQDLPPEVRAESAPWFEQRRRALEAGLAARPALSLTFAAVQARNRRHLVTVLARDDTREALFLSNPESLQRVEALVTQYASEPDPAPDSRARQRLRLGWNYLQRFCAKNDTSSFFGPMAWGRFNPAATESVRIERTGDDWLALRRTFFEHWVLVRLCAAISADERLQATLPVRLNTGCHVLGNVLFHPLDRRRLLDPLSACLLGAFHDDAGVVVPQSVDRLLQRADAAGFDRGQAQALLERYRHNGVVESAVLVPPGHPAPMDCLRAHLVALAPVTPAVNAWLLRIDALEAERLRFETGDLAVRRSALDALRQLLEAAGIDLHRDQGRMYVGRFPVYEDCSRSLQVTVGGTLASDIDRCLQPVMDLHHWLAGAAAVRLHDVAASVFEDLSSRESGPDVDFLAFGRQLREAVSIDAVIAELRRLLTDAWQSLAPALRGPVAGQLALRPGDLAALLERLHVAEPRALTFDGFNLAGVHSPDFMLAASGTEALGRGDYTLVIGEIHPAVHTVSQPVAQPFCPAPAALRDEVSAVLHPRTAVLADSPESYQRSHIDWLDVPELFHVLLPGGVGRGEPGRCLPAGRGRVCLRDGILHYEDRVAGLSQPLLSVTPSDVHRVCFALASDLIGYGLPERITMGRLLLKRRAWNLSPAELPSPGTPAEDLPSFLLWRRWARQLGMPRHVFAKLAGEPKPILVDFDNAMSLDLLASLCKTPQPMRITEMRPAPDELWLHDTRGRYCCEFRTSFTARARGAETAPSETP